MWLSTLVLAIGALAVSFVLMESSRVAAGSKTMRAENSAVTIQSSEQMTVMVYLPVVCEIPVFDTAEEILIPSRQLPRWGARQQQPGRDVQQLGAASAHGHAVYLHHRQV
jgi:hypothetical protein